MRSMLWTLVCPLMAASLSQGMEVHRWGLFETSLVSRADHNGTEQYLELAFTFTDADGQTYQRRGFWDGGDVWKVRFSPPTVGTWAWRSHCMDDETLDGAEGTFVCTPYEGDNPLYTHGPIRVSDNGHHFVHDDGTPFFWLVDTAWNGALKAGVQDWDRFLSDRSAKRFTGIQYVVSQWRTAYANAEGKVAYTGYEKIKINPDFFKRIDERTQAVNEHGLLAVPVLLWTLGSREHNPGQLPEDQAVLLARYMTARLGAYHVSWFLPGDGNYFGDNAERWKRIGRAVFDRPDHAPVTLHPQGMQWPWDAFGQEKWVSYFGYQSGHGDDGRTLQWIYDGPPARKWHVEPVRPVINLEPPYEDHIAYQSRKRHTAYSVRRAVYWSLLNAPTAGTSYGAHGVWSWETAPNTPQEHGGTGIAQPWHKAMALPGSAQMGHMADLFGSIQWWRLRPEDALVAGPQDRQTVPGRVHVVYTRGKDGLATLYLDGLKVAERTVAGDLSNWSRQWQLGLANEMTQDRPWLGRMYQIALYDRALAAAEVQDRFRVGSEARPANPLVLYTFSEGRGDIVMDTSGNAQALNLKISKPEAVRWIAGGGLDVRGSALIASDVPASKVCDAIARSRQITIEAWIEPANLTQAGPARIVSMSENTSYRNFTLGQAGAAFEVRFRTVQTSANGEPALANTADSSESRHISAARSENGDLAVLYCPVGDEITIKPDLLRDDLKAQWFDPRTGERTDARPEGPNRYRTPDNGDWVLIFQ